MFLRVGNAVRRSGQNGVLRRRGGYHPPATGMSVRAKIRADSFRLDRKRSIHLSRLPARSVLLPDYPPRKRRSPCSLGDSPRCGEMSSKTTEGTAAVSGASQFSCLLTSASRCFVRRTRFDASPHRRPAPLNFSFLPAHCQLKKDGDAVLFSQSKFLCILPLMVLGSSSRKTTRRGYL